MNKSPHKGSIGLLLLWCCCFITLIVSLASYFLTEAHRLQRQKLQQLQLRTLAGSAIIHLAQQSTLQEGTHRLGAVTLYPGKLSATLDYGYLKSRDNSFNFLYTRAATSQDSSYFQKSYFQPSEEIYSLTQNYGVIATYGITNSKYLPQGTLYTSNREFTLPSFELLEQFSQSSLDQEAWHANGGRGSFILIRNSTTPTRLSYVKETPIVGGTLLLASRGDLILEKNFHASEQLILITDRGIITLEDNVTLNKALIISGGRLTIGKNCKINGIIMAHDRIVLQGNCNITRDTDVVAPFVSPIISSLE